MPNALQRKKLSKQNIEAFQDYLTSLSHPDTVLEWISLASTMTGSDSAGAVSKKRKAVQTASTVPSMIASSRGSEYSRAYTQTLYQLGLLESNKLGIIPSVPSQTEVCKYFSEPTDIPLLSGFIQWWLRNLTQTRQLWYVFSPSVYLYKRFPFLVNHRLLYFTNFPVHSSPMTRRTEKGEHCKGAIFCLIINDQPD